MSRHRQVVIAGGVAGALALSAWWRMGRPGVWFSWDELQATSTGRENAAPPEARLRLRALVGAVLDPLRWRLGRPVRVTSAYRSEAVNRAVGGSATSQHVTGEAADIVVAGMTGTELAAEIIRMRLPFDQLIAYAPSRGGHVHVSYRADGDNRGQVLYALPGGGFSAGLP